MTSAIVPAVSNRRALLVVASLCEARSPSAIHAARRAAATEVQATVTDRRYRLKRWLLITCTDCGNEDPLICSLSVLSVLSVLSAVHPQVY